LFLNLRILKNCCTRGQFFIIYNTSENKRKGPAVGTIQKEAEKEPASSGEECLQGVFGGSHNSHSSSALHSGVCYPSLQDPVRIYEANSACG
jgi:hypothetical protein